MSVMTGADVRRQLGAQRQQRGDDRDDDHRPPVEVQRAERDLAAGEAEHLAEIGRPALGDRRRADRELQHQVPADDPGHQLAEAGVGERVGAARDRHGGGELGVAQGRQPAGDRGEDERHRYGGPGDAAGGGRGDGEDARADHHRHAEDHQVPPGQVLAQSGARLVGVRDRLLDGLGSPAQRCAFHTPYPFVTPPRT